MAESNLIYAKVVRVTHVYLGPAADRFIVRQVKNHLHIEPSKLTKSDLDKLIDWIVLAVSLLTEDRAIIEEYTQQLRRLTLPEKSNNKNKKVRA